MKAEDRDRIRSGLSPADLAECIPEEPKHKATNSDARRNRVVQKARQARIGIRDERWPARDEYPQKTDSIVVGAIIANCREPIPESAIATGLRWPPDRVDEAMTDLARRLLATGQRLAKFDDGTVEIRPAFDYLDESHITKAFAASVRDTGLSRDQLSILYRFAVKSGKRKSVFGKPERIDPNVQVLLEHGYLVENGSTIEVANHVRFSLMDERVELPYAPPHSVIGK